MLRAHQAEAVDAAVRALGAVPSAGAGLRATIVSACGTGKTFMGAHTALRVAGAGLVLVLVPTLDLLVQTVAAWREAGRGGAMVGVCSLRADAELAAAGVQCTTDARQLLEWAGRAGRVTVFATYASLPVLAEAHGAGLRRWDLMVVDEAHRTSGPWGKPWAAVHDDAALPADRRLYLTATPRVADYRAVADDKDDGSYSGPVLLASMDDEQVFGPVVYRLSLAEAIARGLLARYQIIVLEISAPALAPEEGPQADVSAARLEVLTTAVLKAAAVHQLDRVMTFHHRVAEARAFDQAVTEASGHLWGAKSAVYPRRVWSGWLYGGHQMAHRRQVLAQFARGWGTDGVVAERCVLSSARVLAEGVDIPEVDAVVFADPRESIVDTVQTVGRALRQSPRGDKVASLLVPVFLSPDERREDWLASGSYLPLVKVLTALAAHDTDVVDRLAAWPGNNATGAASLQGPLLFATARDAADIAEFVRLRVINLERRGWLRGWAAGRRFHAAHGHLNVPYHAKDGAFPLGQWIAEQRKAYGSGRLAAVRIDALERLGMVWSHPDHAFNTGLQVARAYHAVHGHLAAGHSAVMDGYPVGTWLANRRREARLADGTRGALSAKRKAALAEVDPYWCPQWPLVWQRRYTLLRQHVAAEGAADIAPGHVMAGEDVGAWLARQQADWGILHTEQRRLLTELGAIPGEGGVQEEARVTHDDKFTRNLAAAAAYAQREGHLNVPRKHVEIAEGTEIRLGIWISNQRSRRAKLAPQRIDALNALGMRWS
ncbi:DEAD/DEAH box helicase [Streptomyces sp. WAC 01529]|uniref:DEAD/DEAH box helicase n=1 Tax=Streptomyces sp. WAC 01529 TaxID=2203205 RepID=UPI001F0BB4CE|nr:DEAD/DEAH box helicase [Streptomyces sp. WAC 01529]